MTFQEKYTQADFLAVLDPRKPKTTTVVAKQVGCARNTAIRFLQDLEKAGKANQVEIEGGFFAWVRAEPQALDQEDLDRFRGCVEKYLAEYPDSAIARKVLDSL